MHLLQKSTAVVRQGEEVVNRELMPMPRQEALAQEWKNQVPPLRDKRVTLPVLAKVHEGSMLKGVVATCHMPSADAQDVLANLGIQSHLLHWCGLQHSWSSRGVVK